MLFVDALIDAAGAASDWFGARRSPYARLERADWLKSAARRRWAWRGERGFQVVHGVLAIAVNTSVIAMMWLRELVESPATALRRLWWEWPRRLTLPLGHESPVLGGLWLVAVWCLMAAALYAGASAAFAAVVAGFD